MMNSVTLIVMVLAAPFSTSARDTKKAEKPKAEWNLSGLFESKAQWIKAQKSVESEIERIKECKGKLLKNAKILQSCLDQRFKAAQSLAEIWSWASLQKSTDSLSAHTTEMTGQVKDLYSRFSQATSFFAPEIALADKKKIDAFQKQNRKLTPYSQYLRNIRIQSKHILTTQEERIISAFRPVASNGQNTFGLLNNADIKWPEIILSTGKATIDTVGYSMHRQSKNRADRRLVFNAFYNALKQYERTYGSTLGQSVKSRTIEAKLRGYNNALDQSLSSENIPESIYRTLVKEVNKGLPTLHRYLRIRQSMLGVKDHQYIDIYPSVTKSKKVYSIEETRKMTIDSVKPLGEDYVSRLSIATKKDWMDVYPRKGKRPGAFMSGSAYRLHPFVFLNHQDDYNSASTYAHEWGHAMHSIYSNEGQPYAKSRYSIFVGEIAAIVNETLMIEKAIKEAASDDEKLYYLGFALEFIRATYFRQTQFSEFELKIHELIEKGEALSGQKISQVYGSIVRKYYGHDKGVLKVDERFFTEWAFVPHFYYGFYVYKYSTSIAAAYYFVEKILAGDKETLKLYLNVLKAGGSKYPHEILLDAGLDLSKPDAYQAIDKKANQIMDEMEAILKKKGGTSPP